MNDFAKALWFILLVILFVHPVTLIVVLAYIAIYFIIRKLREK